MNRHSNSPQVIVSLTSFPAAIPYAKEAILSILYGNTLPDKLVLYVTLSQFAGTDILNDIINISKENSIFEIRDYPSDIKSYRKLIPALIDFPDAIIVTIDDDVKYHKNMLQALLDLHKQFPHAILAHRAKLIKPDKAYRKWRKFRWYHFLFKKIHSSFFNIQTGVGGVLYPPHSLKSEMLNPTLFTSIAPTTDDIWFWAAAVANDYPIIPVPFGYNKPRGLHKPRELSLKTLNFKSTTDLNASTLKAILDKYPEIKRKIHQ
jgi:hypothetical protein